ncbi:MAG: histidinol-phosphate transaminase [Actinomycetota bacterium]
MNDPSLSLGVRGRSDLADLKPYRAPQLDAPVKLNTNESPFPPPESFTRQLQELVARLALNRYPLRDFLEVREALSSQLGTLTDRVWLANGSNEIILQLLLAYGGSERKIMTFEPTYEMHGHITRVSGTRHLRARRNPNYTMHPEASLEAIQVHRPDIVFLCSPNNPTGNSNTAEEVAAICEVTPALVILDEAYVEFSGRSHLRMIEEFDNLVVVRTFSKAWRMAGARIGYLVAQPQIIEEIQKVRLPYHLSSLTQAAALAGLANAAEMKGAVQTMVHERDRIFRELSTMRGLLAFPSDANFVLFRCESRVASELWQDLLDRGVLIRDFSATPGCEGCLRVSVGTREQNEKFLEAISLLAVPREQQ